jgi:hypothetical protein
MMLKENVFLSAKNCHILITSCKQGTCGGRLSPMKDSPMRKSGLNDLKSLLSSLLGRNSMLGPILKINALKFFSSFLSPPRKTPEQ